MPVRNEAAFISRSLGAVLAQNYPSDRMEVLVADGMSTDKTRALIHQLQAQHPDVLVRLLDNQSGIVSTGINIALDSAQGEVIVRVDGHTVIASDYLTSCVEALQRSGVDNVGGRMNAVSESLIGLAVVLATSSRFGVGGARFHYSEREEFVDTVYMGAWPRNVFRRIGVFDEEMVRNQDDEFNYRLRARGGRILLSPQIKSHYYSRSTLWSLGRQYFEYGLWKVRVLQKHPCQMRPRHFIPALCVILLLLSLSLGARYWFAEYLGVATAAVYLTASVAASLFILRRNNWWSFPFVPFAFATMHFAYGVGFLLGLVRFCRYWSIKRTSQRSIKEHLAAAKGA